MAHFDLATVTDAGNEMLNEMMAGEYITVAKAVAGDGSAAGLDELRKLTTIKEKQALSIVDDRVDGQGRTIALQVINTDESYAMRQIGVYARLGAEGEEKLLYVLQDTEPITVPDNTAPAFFLDIYTHLNINNEVGRFEVKIDTTGTVNVELLNSRLEQHNTDPDAHLIPDDSTESKYRIGVQNGKLYMEAIESE